jgi:hypothetical protein
MAYTVLHVLVRTSGVPRGDGYPRAGRRWCPMESRGDDDDDDHLRGWRCFRKLRSWVRAMVDEEDPFVCGIGRPVRGNGQPNCTRAWAPQLTVKIAPSARLSSSSPPPSASVISVSYYYYVRRIARRPLCPYPFKVVVCVEFRRLESSSLSLSERQKREINTDHVANPEDRRLSENPKYFLQKQRKKDDFVLDEVLLSDEPET